MSSNSVDLWDETGEYIEQALIQQLTEPPAQYSRRRYVHRNRDEGASRLHNDYFAEEPVYDEKKFRQRYRLSKNLFLRIVEALQNHTPYFTQRPDAVGKMGFTGHKKCTVALSMLANGEFGDREDECFRMAETTTLECLSKFCRALIDVFGAEYLRTPNADDVKRLFKMHEDIHGLPGMLGSLDCMHWKWQNCRVAWKGQYTRGDHGVPIIMLEAVASQDTWIWHAFFGVAGSNNDLNVLNRSTLFYDKIQGHAPVEEFTVNNNLYKMGYYLADGIYPEWGAFVKSCPHAVTPKTIAFRMAHDFARKDVERAFGILQKIFAIIRGPARLWEETKLHDIMEACIILHNMIVEEERHKYRRSDKYPPIVRLPDLQNLGVSRGPPCVLRKCIERSLQIRSRVTHRNLKNDLIEHIWLLRGVVDLNEPSTEQESESSSD